MLGLLDGIYTHIITTLVYTLKYTYYTYIYVNTYSHRTMNVGFVFVSLVGRNNVGNETHYILKAKSMHEDLKKTFEKSERDLISCSEGWDQSSMSIM